MPSQNRLNPRRELAFLVLSGLFLGSMSLLNVLGLSRFINFGRIGPFPIVVTIGVLPYPITFLCTDVISEIWGERRASQLVWVGLLVNVWILLVVWFGGILPGFEQIDPTTGLPAVDEAGRQPLFFELRRLTMGTTMASMVAYLTAQLTDVRLFHAWKRLTRGRYLWLRNNGSTMVSQLVDTSVVVLVTHLSSDVLPLSSSQAVLPQLAGFVLTGYSFKFLCALADTLPCYWLVGWLRQHLDIPGQGRELGAISSSEEPPGPGR
ncbi:MAG: queuosine precursor transporter [Cyanobacteria bacterium MAG APA_bin_95]|nr:queuosine precursor transporter [Cyanobacteria bacterium MAG APA_bin_95]